MIDGSWQLVARDFGGKLVVQSDKAITTDFGKLATKVFLKVHWYRWRAKRQGICSRLVAKPSDPFSKNVKVLKY
jgi:hypothetical protein